MGNENHYRHHYHQSMHIHHRSTFLPMLCSRPSIKDVSLPRWRDRAGSSCDDPLSPRIGCMGQVKRNNKIAGFPTSHRLSLISKSSTSTSTSTSTSPVVKYSKLKKLLSKSTTTTTTTISSCGSRKQRVADGVKNHRCRRNENLVSTSIEDMDPPLPVIKRVHKLEADSLWQRRLGGHELKSLQLHHPRICLQPTSVWCMGMGSDQMSRIQIFYFFFKLFSSNSYLHQIRYNVNGFLFQFSQFPMSNGLLDFLEFLTWFPVNRSNCPRSEMVVYLPKWHKLCIERLTK